MNKDSDEMHAQLEWLIPIFNEQFERLKSGRNNSQPSLVIAPEKSNEPITGKAPPQKASARRAVGTRIHDRDSFLSDLKRLVKRILNLVNL